MPRSTRLLIILAVLCVTFTLFMMSAAQASQTVISTPSDSDIDLTLSWFAAELTQVPQTREALAPTRTAVAITRDFSLLTPSTPSRFELIVTESLANFTATELAYTPPGEGTVADVYLTAIKFFNGVTQTIEAITREPSLALTIYPTSTPGPCTLSLYNYHMNDLASEIEIALNSVGFVNADAGGFSTGVWEGERGCSTRYPLETRITVSVVINNPSDEAIAAATANILAVLSEFPRQDTYGSQKARLIIFFEDSNQQNIGIIDTGYNNALDAYAEGLLGADLLLALGELLPVILPIIAG